SGWFVVRYVLGGVGPVNFVTDSPNGLWSTVLVLPDFKTGDRVKFDAEGKIAIGSDALSLRGRDLRGAVFTRAHLDKADFTGAELQQADFQGAELRQAKFECDPDGWQIVCAQLQGVDLKEAKLQGAVLFGAQLQDANLFEAQLQGADLAGAQLQGADLGLAKMQGANLWRAQLQGVVDLLFTELQGANLVLAGLQGIDLSGADLQGANLLEAQLQGADLAGAQLQGADLDGAVVWRAKAPNKRDQVQDMWGKPETRAKSNGLECSDNRLEPCDWTPASYAALKAEIEKAMPPGPSRDAALKRIAVLEKPPEAGDDKLAGLWTALSKPRPRTGYGAALAITLQRYLCTADSVADAIGGLVPQLDDRFVGDSTQEAELANAFLDESKCPAAHGLSEETKSRLQQIVSRGANPTPGAGTASR
ncbi:MAG TPA: pentapeptide repeat-containing protein, partial [Stellaceae bacterium]|nr:pentapeptide repeat-containing protein [Stellaceae bacterium]